MPWNEFLLPILPGYIFINFLYLTKFRAQRHDGYRLLFESLLFGAFLFALARVVVILLAKDQIGQAAEGVLIQEGVTFPFAGTVVLASIFSLATARIGNLLIGTERAKRIILEANDNRFLKLFHKAATDSRMVSVTLSCRKVYIGYVISAPNFSPEEQFVGLLPVVSGYRDKDTLNLVITTNYGPAISSGTTPVEDFEVTFSLASVDVASLFEPKAYPLFGVHAQETADRPAQRVLLDSPASTVPQD